MADTETLLVRHGESVANAGAVTSDYARIPLTARGRSQAESIAEAFSAEPAWIGSSSFVRATETAAPLCRRYPRCPAVVLPVHEFTYLAASRCAAMDATARQPLVDAYWSRMDPGFCDGDDAESFAALIQRGISFLEDVIQRPSGGVVFTHEQFIRLIVLLALSPTDVSPQSLMRRFWSMRTALPIPNCATVRLRHVEGRWWVSGPVGVVAGT